MKTFALVLTAMVLASVPAFAAPKAPIMSITDYAQLKTPIPLPYDEAADADQVVDKARAQAKAQKKLLLIDLGGNWCPDCRVLAATMDLPELKRFMDAHFVTVLVDVGRFNKNLQIPARYGITSRLAGVPAVMIVDPKTDKLINDGRITELSDARHMSPQGLADWLASWAR